MGITQEHAVRRIEQLTAICMNIVQEHEVEAEQEYQDAVAFGLDVEKNSVVIQSASESVYTVWHNYIQFYSQFL